MVRIHPSALGAYMKTLGIIGGFGPETTAQFQLAIIERCRAKGSLVRPEIIMWSAPIPLQIEEDLILHQTSLQSFLPFLIQGARALEKAGASLLVLPCNTLHIFIKEIQNAVHIPLLSITDAALNHLITCKVKQIAVFGTKTTIDQNIFTDKLTPVGITPILPTSHEQTAIDQVIFDILNVKSHRKASRILNAIAMECKQRGARDILLACTDLQIVFPTHKEVRVHDTMHILADACVREILE